MLEDKIDISLEADKGKRKRLPVTLVSRRLVSLEGTSSPVSLAITRAIKLFMAKDTDGRMGSIPIGLPLA